MSYSKKLLDRENETRTECMRTYKDRVFRTMFSNKTSMVKFYKRKHPEDADITEEDITDVTLQKTYVKGPVNDIAFSVKGKILIFLEAQSTWLKDPFNTFLVYHAQTIQKLSDEDWRKRIDLLNAEYYIIFTGDPINKPETMHLKDIFTKSDLDMKVNILFGDENDPIVYQYVKSMRIMDAHMRTECSLKSVREALDEIRGLGLDMDFDSMEREIMDTFEEFYSEKNRSLQDFYARHEDEIRELESASKAEGKAEGKEETKNEVLAMIEQGYSIDEIRERLQSGSTEKK